MWGATGILGPWRCPIRIDERWPRRRVGWPRSRRMLFQPNELDDGSSTTRIATDEPQEGPSSKNMMSRLRSSSTDVREPSDSAAAAAEILDRVGGRWALIGALAALQYRATSRMTTDVDVLAEPIDGLSAAFEAAGYDVEEFAEADDEPYLICVRGKGRSDRRAAGDHRLPTRGARTGYRSRDHRGGRDRAQAHRVASTAIETTLRPFSKRRRSWTRPTSTTGPANGTSSIAGTRLARPADRISARTRSAQRCPPEFSSLPFRFDRPARRAARAPRSAVAPPRASRGTRPVCSGDRTRPIDHHLAPRRVTEWR